MSPLRIAAQLLRMAAAMMHELDDVNLSAMLPDDDERRTVVRACTGRDGAARYVPAKQLYLWMASHLEEAARETEARCAEADARRDEAGA